jgi:outer membrane protein TolC
LDRDINQKLLNVEVAYWNLYAARWTLHSREVGLRSAYETFQLSKSRYEAGRATTADVAQARGQYELFRAQRLQALDSVLESEHQLRALAGLPAEDGTRLAPSDSPSVTHTQPDWETALDQTLANRPELELARQEVLQAEQVLSLARTLGDWLVGLAGLCPPPSRSEGTQPPGEGWGVIRLHADLVYQSRSTSLQVRRAQLQLARALETLKDQELKAERFLGLQYRRISTSREQVRANRAQREAFEEQLRARQQEYLAGRGTLDLLLEAQRFCADCLSSEHQALATYNNALAGFEFARGTIQQHDNVVIVPDSPGP